MLPNNGIRLIIQIHHFILCTTNTLLMHVGEMTNNGVARQYPHQRASTRHLLAKPSHRTMVQLSMMAWPIGSPTEVHQCIVD